MSKNPNEYVLLIHGTNAQHKADDLPEEDAEREGRWWHRNSLFWKRINELLEGHASCGFFKEDRDKKVLFHWSGANSERHRRKYAKKLYDAVINSYEDEDKPYHLIGHSHGGSIIWHMLCLAVAKTKKGEAALPNLKSWTTMGTPFLHFRPRWEELWLLIPLIVSVLVWLPAAYLTGNFIREIGFSFSQSWPVNQVQATHANVFEFGPWITTFLLDLAFISFLVILILVPLFLVYLLRAVVLVLGLVLRILWIPIAYGFFGSQIAWKRRGPQSTEKEESVGMAGRLLTSFLVLLLILGSLVLVVFWDWLSNTFFSDSLVSQQELFRLLGAVVFTTILGVFILILALVRISPVLCHGVAGLYWHRIKRKALNRFGKCYRGIGSPDDEAINGLSRITPRIKGEVAPRLAPFFVFYNHILKPMTDARLLWIVSKTFHGNDLHGLTLHAVTRGPVLDFEHEVLDKSIAENMKREANRKLEALGDAIRTQIGLSSETASDLQYQLKELGKALKGPELVHNSYYDIQHQDIIKLIAYGIRLNQLDKEDERNRLAICTELQLDPALVPIVASKETQSDSETKTAVEQEGDDQEHALTFQSWVGKSLAAGMRWLFAFLLPFLPAVMTLLVCQPMVDYTPEAQADLLIKNAKDTLMAFDPEADLDDRIAWIVEVGLKRPLTKDVVEALSTIEEKEARLKAVLKLATVFREIPNQEFQDVQALLLHYASGLAHDVVGTGERKKMEIFLPLLAAAGAAGNYEKRLVSHAHAELDPEGRADLLCRVAMSICSLKASGKTNEDHPVKRALNIVWEIGKKQESDTELIQNHRLHALAAIAFAWPDADTKLGLAETRSKLINELEKSLKPVDVDSPHDENALLARLAWTKLKIQHGQEGECWKALLIVLAITKETGHGKQLVELGNFLAHRQELHQKMIQLSPYLMKLLSKTTIPDGTTDPDESADRDSKSFFRKWLALALPNAEKRLTHPKEVDAIGESLLRTILVKDLSLNEKNKLRNYLLFSLAQELARDHPALALSALTGISHELFFVNPEISKDDYAELLILIAATEKARQLGKAMENLVQFLPKDSPELHAGVHAAIALTYHWQDKEGKEEKNCWERAEIKAAEARKIANFTGMGFLVKARAYAGYFNEAVEQANLKISSTEKRAEILGAIAIIRANKKDFREAKKAINIAKSITVDKGNRGSKIRDEALQAIAEKLAKGGKMRLAIEAANACFIPRYRLKAYLVILNELEKKDQYWNLLRGGWLRGEWSWGPTVSVLGPKAG